MTYSHDQTEHNQLLEDNLDLLIEAAKKRPILDVAGGDCRNSVYIAKRNLDAVCCDISEEALAKGKALAERENVNIRLWRVDLEQESVNPLPEATYGGIMVFRFLSRPLIPCLRKALAPGGMILYETFTANQARFGKPSNPDFLLKPGELKRFFDDWDILHYFEGLLDDPPREVAQLVARKNI